MQPRLPHSHGTLTRIGAPALWALRVHWRSAALVVSVVAAALGALVPIASLLTLAGPGIQSRLHPWTLGNAHFGTLWDRDAQSPAALQQLAVDVAVQLLIFTAAAVLAVAALTALTLFAARASQRAREMVVRRAVGAGRRAVLAACLLEGALLAAGALAIGGIVGTIAAHAAIDEWPGAVDPGRLTANAIVASALAVAVLLGALFPGLVTPRRRLVDAAANPVPLFVPAIQLGLSLLVLAVGAHLARHAAASRPDPRAPRAGEVFAATPPDGPPADRAARYATLLDRLSRNPEFDSVSLTSPGAAVGLGTVAVVTTLCGYCGEGGIRAPWHYESAVHEFVSADSFQAMGLHLLAGRAITAADEWSSPRVAVVSRGLARRHFQDGNAIGSMIKVGDDPVDWHTVVGVVDDAPRPGLGAALEPPFTVYLSVLQHPVPSVELLVRPRPGRNVDDAFVARALAESLGSGVPVHRVSESRLLAAQVAPVAWLGRWLDVEGWAMLAIATTGTFALMRLWVLSLLTELGMRRAAGARRAQILGLVLWRAAGVGVAGTAVGLWLAPGVWRLIESAIPGLPVWSPGLVAPLAALLVTVTIAGALLPAWHAAQMTPAALLDFEAD